MRLTNVSQMQVRPGRLFSCRVEAGPLGGPLPVSFDQGRHVGFGSRPGSWMAVSFRLPRPASREQIAAAWQAVIERHGTLRSVFTWEPPGADDDGGLGLRQAEVTVTGWERLGPASSSPRPVGFTAAPAAPPEPGRAEGVLTEEQVREALRAHFDSVCDPFGRPSHRLCVIEPGAPQEGDRPRGEALPAPAEAGPVGTDAPQVVIGSDHAHVDAWSLLVLVRDLTAFLDEVQAGRTPGEGAPEAEPFAAHTELLASRGMPPEGTVGRWREILDAGDGAMPGFPLDLGDLSVPRDEVVEVRDVFDAAELARAEEHAAEQGVRLIALAVSVMTRLTRELADRPLRTVFPVHSREDKRWFGSVGWFITNSVLENDDAGLASSYAAVKEAVGLGSHPLAPIMRPYGGMPQHPGMFAMSWLDHRRLPVHVPEELEPQHVSAVVRTDGVMIWFVINSSGMHLRCRYPDTRQARRSVGTWLGSLVEGLRAPSETAG